MVDVKDLKSFGLIAVPVQVRPEAPFAVVMELVYVSALEAEFCRFESCQPHQKIINDMWVSYNGYCL